jgi:hypothetical protein
VRLAKLNSKSFFTAIGDGEIDWNVKAIRLIDRADSKIWSGSLPKALPNSIAEVDRECNLTVGIDCPGHSQMALYTVL